MARTKTANSRKQGTQTPHKKRRLSGEARMSDWFGCYAPYPKDLVVAESFTHPAKLPPSLMYRILARLEELGLQRGGKILDPFAGIGGTLLCAGLLGYETYGMELEDKFVKLIEQNIAKNKHKFKHQPVIKRGDSTKDLLAAFGGEKFIAVVGSPAFGEALDRNRHKHSGGRVAVMMKDAYLKDKQGLTPGQMANLPEGDFDSVISSPPYIKSVHDGGIDCSKLTGNPAGENTQAKAGGYGKTEGQIERFPEGDFAAVVSSPPFQETVNTKDPKYVQQKKLYGDYGKSKGQLGNESGETYWSACRDIYFNCFLLLGPGGFIALVVKSFIRKKKIVDLPSMTWELLQAVGFTPVERNRAWLVEERAAATFFEANYSVKKERKSFFRRLAEKKGSPKIDFEEVLICRKP